MRAVNQPPDEWIEDYQGVLNWAENIRVFFSFSSDAEKKEKPLHNK